METIESRINGVQTDHVCPKCGHTQSVNLFPVIDFKKNPEYYALVKDLSIYSVKCEKCGYEELCLFDSLIIDESHGYILYVLSDRGNLNRFRHQIEYFVETVLNKEERFDTGKMKTRVVFAHNDLLEKIAIFEVGLDDEIIEVMKYGIGKQEGFDSDTYDEIYFDGIVNTDLIFVAFSSKSDTIEPKTFKISFEGYNKIVDDLKPLKNRQREYFEAIDQQWAATVMKEV